VPAQIIDGKAVARRIEEEVAAAIGRLGFAPGLVAVRVGNDPASEIYVRNKAKKARELGLTILDEEAFTRLLVAGPVPLEVESDPLEDERFNEERAAVVERMLRERMEELPAEQFQDLLRPCFKEDEWILIALGGVLGFLAGVGQIFFVFG